MTKRRTAINRSKVPAQYPTNFHAPAFWEELGRTIATFGFLEEVLGKAIFALTATTEYSETEAQAALAKWPEVLKHALYDTLYPLAEVYGRAVRKHQDANFPDVGDVVDDIKRAAEVRNAICHGSWRAPDAAGGSALYYFNKQVEKFNTPVDLAWLRQVQAHVRGLAFTVIDSVTFLGHEFPGGAGPDEPIWSK